LAEDLSEVTESAQGPSNAAGPRSIRKLVTNALLNLCRGAASALLPILLPAVLLRQLHPPEAFSAWVLILQVAAYVGLLDLGLQVAVGRFVAREHELNETASRNAYYRTALLLLAACSVLGALAVIVVSFRFELLFPAVHGALIEKARWSMLVVGLAAALGLPGSAAAGFFIGLERNVVPTVVLGLGKALQGVATTWAAWSTHDLFITASAFAASYLATQIIQVGSVRFLVRDSRHGASQLAQEPLKELINYCATLSLWTVGGLLVTGLDIILVNRFQFGLVAAYASAANLIAVFVGIMSSAFNVLGARSSSMDAAGESERLGTLLLASSRWCSLLTVLLGVTAWSFARWGLNHWLGPSVGADALPLFHVLVIANAVRMPLVPYSVVLLGTGQQKLALWAPFAEGVANLAASLVLGSIYGAIGVAFGTLAGAAVGVFWQIVVNMPKTVRIPCRPLPFIREGYAIPAVALLPLAGLTLVPSGGVRHPAQAGIGLLVLALIWFVGVPQTERKRLLGYLGGRSRSTKGTTT